jgi:hypothetical protein
MVKLLKKGYSSFISQLHYIQVVETPSVHINLQSMLYQHQFVFNTPQGLPLSHNSHDHSIPLVAGSVPLNVHTYHHPFSQKNEISKIVQELLEVGVILLSTKPYSSPISMVLKKEGTWHMCPYLCALKKITIKDIFSILVIDDLLDESSDA